MRSAEALRDLAEYMHTQSLSFWAWDKRRDGIFLLGLLLVSLALNVFFASKIRGLTWHERRTNTIEGKSVASFTVKALDGRDATLNCVASKPTLLYVFAPTCIWCKRNAPNIEVVAAAASKAYNVVGLSLAGPDETKAFLEKHPLNFPAFSQPSAELVALLDLGATPQTIVLDTHAAVAKNWVGVYSGTVMAGVEQYFHLKLPGVIE